MYDDVISLTRELLQRQSLTPDDAGVQDVIAEALSEVGFSCEDMSENGIRNTWYRLGDQAPVMCFAGHSDVVPVGDEQDWQFPPFLGYRT